MTERKPHPDNELIDSMQDDAIPTAQQGRSGGNVNRRVGTRADLHRAEGNLTGEEVETAVGSDNPEQDARKGEKTFNKIRTGKQNG